MAIKHVMTDGSGKGTLQAKSCKGAWKAVHQMVLSKSPHFQDIVSTSRFHSRPKCVAATRELPGLHRSPGCMARVRKTQRKLKVEQDGKEYDGPFA